MSKLSVEEIINLIIESTGMTRSEIQELINRQRELFGESNITERSAALLVAKEFNVKIKPISFTPSSIKISDLTEGMNNVVLEGKVLSISDVRSFKRSDGSTGYVCNLIVGDDSGNIRIVLWDNHTTAVSDGHINIGDIIRILGGYTRPGRFDNLEVNLGRRGKIIINPPDVDPSKYDDISIETSFVELGSLAPNLYNISVKGTIIRKYDPVEFTRKDGQPGRVFSAIIGDNTGSVRISFWNDLVDYFDKISEGTELEINNLYTRSSDRGIELHTSSKSTIKIIGTNKDFIPGSLVVNNLSEVKPRQFDITVEGKVIQISEIREFSRSDGRNGKVRNITIADEYASRRVVFWDDQVDKTIDLSEGDIIRIEHAYTKDGTDDFIDIHVGRKAVIIINPEESRLEEIDVIKEIPKFGNYKPYMIDELEEGMFAEVSGIIVQVSERKPVYEACPNCMRKVTWIANKPVCKVCGELDSAIPKLIFNVHIDDGSGSMRITLVDEAAEKLLNMTPKEALDIVNKTGRDEAPIIDNISNILGRYISVRGKVTRSEFNDQLEIISRNIEFTDPIEKSNYLLKKVKNLSGG